MLFRSIPLLWLLAVTGTAAAQKIWSNDARVGFLAGAATLEKKAAGLKEQPELMAQAAKQAANLRLDAAVTGFFLALVTGIFLISLREWMLLLGRKKLAELRETAPTWLPAYAVSESKSTPTLGLIALAFGLAKELTGEAALDRARQAAVCECGCAPTVNLLGQERATPPAPSQEKLYVETVERRFGPGINRCC